MHHLYNNTVKMNVSIAERIIFTIYYCFLGVFGLIANIAILVILCGSKEYRWRLSTQYLYGVVLSRILACIIEIPYYMFSVIANLPEPNSNAYETECRITLFFTYSIGTVKILVLVGMSLDRFIAVLYPYFYNSHMTTIKVGMINALLWIAAVVLTVPLSVKPGLGRYYGDIGASCGVNYNLMNKGYFLCALFLVFIFPASIMAVTNTKVFIVARKQKSQIHNEFMRHETRIAEILQEHEDADQMMFHVRESGSMVNQNDEAPCQQDHSITLDPNRLAVIGTDTRKKTLSTEERDIGRNMLRTEASRSTFHQSNVPSQRKDHLRTSHRPSLVTTGPSGNPEAIFSLKKVPGALVSPKRKHFNGFSINILGRRKRLTAIECIHVKMATRSVNSTSATDGFTPHEIISGASNDSHKHSAEETVKIDGQSSISVQNETKKKSQISNISKHSTRVRAVSKRDTEWSVLGSTLLIVAVFFITWSPYVISRTIDSFIGIHGERVSLYTTALTLLDTFINPLIIIGTRKTFRKKFCNFFFCCKN